MAAGVRWAGRARFIFGVRPVPARRAGGDRLPQAKMTNRLLSFSIYLTATGLGIVTFLYPFFLPVLKEQGSLNTARSGEGPLIYTLLLGLCVLVLLFEVQSQAVDAKLIALLGMLIAINSVLRFIEVAIPGPGGFSPIFFLIILVGSASGRGWVS